MLTDRRRVQRDATICRVDRLAPPTCLDAGKTYKATFVTNEGTIVVNLNTTKTPETANNFIVLSRYHYYDGTAMFRTDTSIGIMQLLYRINRAGTTILMVTHDREMVDKMRKRVIALEDGRLARDERRGGYE